MVDKLMDKATDNQNAILRLRCPNCKSRKYAPVVHEEGYSVCLDGKEPFHDSELVMPLWVWIPFMILFILVVKFYWFD